MQKRSCKSGTCSLDDGRGQRWHLCWIQHNSTRQPWRVDILNISENNSQYENEAPFWKLQVREHKLVPSDSDHGGERSAYDLWVFGPEARCSLARKAQHLTPKRTNKNRTKRQREREAYSFFSPVFVFKAKLWRTLHFAKLRCSFGRRPMRRRWSDTSH